MNLQKTKHLKETIPGNYQDRPIQRKKMMPLKYFVAIIRSDLAPYDSAPVRVARRPTKAIAAAYDSKQRFVKQWKGQSGSFNTLAFVPLVFAPSEIF